MQPILCKTPTEKLSPPPVPSGPGPFTFRCVLIAVRPAELEELAKIFTSRGHEVIQEGAAAFELKTSVDMKYLQIEETYDGSNAGEILERVHSKDGRHWWHERVSVLQDGINAAFWRPIKP